jgi:hypothetical protein
LGFANSAIQQFTMEETSVFWYNCRHYGKRKIIVIIEDFLDCNWASSSRYRSSIRHSISAGRVAAHGKVMLGHSCPRIHDTAGRIII